VNVVFYLGGIVGDKMQSAMRTKIENGVKPRQTKDAIITRQNKYRDPASNKEQFVGDERNRWCTHQF